MKPMKTLLTILFISLLSSPSWSVTIRDLVKRDDLYYEKFTDVPYTGKVTVDEQVKHMDVEGVFKNGKAEGAWIEYWLGQLWRKGNFKNGKEDGAWVYYHDDGQLSSKGNYKNGKREGAWIGYHNNGQLNYKGNYKNGKKGGAWVGYNENGTVDKSLTGTFKNGKKISD